MKRAGGVPWPAQFVLLAVIWGSSFALIKIADRELPVLWVALGRVALGAVALLPLLALRRERLPRDPRLWGHLAVVALVYNAVPFVLFAYGETKVSSVLAGLYNGATPLLVLLVSLAVLPEERPTRERVLGLAVGFCGVVVVLGPWRGLAGGELLGHLACLGAAACYGLAFPYTRRHLAGRAESGVSLTAAQLLCATAELAVLVPCTGGVPDLGVSAGVGLALLGLGALGTGVAYVLNYAIIRAAGAGTASTVTYLIPVFSTALGVLALGEALGWNEPAGALVVLGGIAISQGRVRRRAAVA